MPLAEAVAQAIGVPFAFEWYGDPDQRSYRVDFGKIKERIGFEPQYIPANGAVEVYRAIQAGDLDPDDPKTITVKWYRHLLEEGIQL